MSELNAYEFISDEILNRVPEDIIELYLRASEGRVDLHDPVKGKGLIRNKSHFMRRDSNGEFRCDPPPDFGHEPSRPAYVEYFEESLKRLVSDDNLVRWWDWIKIADEHKRCAYIENESVFTFDLENLITDIIGLAYKADQATRNEGTSRNTVRPKAPLIDNYVNAATDLETVLTDIQDSVARKMISNSIKEVLALKDELSPYEINAKGRGDPWIRFMEEAYHLCDTVYPKPNLIEKARIFEITESLCGKKYNHQSLKNPRKSSATNSK